VETAAAVWNKIKGRSIFINAMLNVTTDCDCLPGNNPVIAPDAGFIGGFHPVAVDEESVKRVGAEAFNKTHPHVNWRRQFSYSREIGLFSQRGSSLAATAGVRLQNFERSSTFFT